MAFTCRDFHDDSRTRCSVDLFQHVEQRLLGYILDIDVDRRADIHSFHRIDLYDIRPSSTETAYGIQAGYAVEQSIVLQFQTVLSLCQPCFRIDIAERVADRTGGKCPERLLQASCLSICGKGKKKGSRSRYVYFSEAYPSCSISWSDGYSNLR